MKFSIEMKEAILKELGSPGATVRGISKKYGIDPGNLRQWRRRHELDSVRRQLHPKLFEKDKKTSNLGRDSTINEFNDELLSFYRERRENDRVVTTTMLMAEYGHLYQPANGLLSSLALCKQIHHWLRAKDIVLHQITHQSQDTHQCSKIINDWVSYVVEQKNAGDTQ